MEFSFFFRLEGVRMYVMLNCFNDFAQGLSTVTAVRGDSLGFKLDGFDF